MKISIWIICLLTFLPEVTSPNLRERNNPTDNFTRLIEIADSLLTKALTKANLSSCSRIVIKNSTPGDAHGWFIEDRLIAILRGRENVSVILSRAPELAAESTNYKQQGYVFEYKVIDIGITYSRKKNGRFFRTGTILRKALLEISVKIYQERGGELIWSGNLRRDKVDEISPDLISKLENVNIAFTQSPIPPGSYLKRILEPAFILSVTGGIIYLFYSFRSQ